MINYKYLLQAYLMRLNYIVLSSIGFGLLFAGLVKPVFAQGCTTQYGGTQTCPQSLLAITKEVQNPITGNFVKGLATTDATVSPSGDVLFRLTIKNISGETLNPVTVTDTFPNVMSFESGPGTFNSANNTLTFTLNNLIAGETRTVQVQAKVAASSAFSSTANFTCVTNNANASANGQSAQDSAQVCIQNKVLGATTLPVAGFDDLYIILPFIGIGLAGLALLRRPGVVEVKKKI